MGYKRTAVLGALVALTGCATSGEINQVESRLEAVQQKVEQLDQRTYTLEQRPTRTRRPQADRFGDRCYGTKSGC